MTMTTDGDTLVEGDESTTLVADPVETPPPGEPTGPAGPTPPGESGGADAPIKLIALSTGLAGLAAAWMAAGVFKGVLPRLLALVAAAIGAAIVAYASRPGGRTAVAYLALPVALTLAAIAAVTAPNAGGTSVPSLVREALRNGLLQPPVPFDPGWRFMLVLFAAVVAAAATSIALATGRPKLGVAVVAPVVFLGALAQPPSATVVSSVISFGLIAAGFALAYGADLRAQGSTSGEFETRRLIKGAGVLGGLLGVLLVVGQLGLLLPEPDNKVTVPPQRPKPSPPVADRELFTVKSTKPQVWRLGVLDGYDGEAFLTPPYDSSRFRKVGGSGEVPDEPLTGATSKLPRVETTFTLANLPYSQLPSVASPVRVERDDLSLEYDPRTQTFRLPDGRPEPGTTYTIESPPGPTGIQMQTAPAFRPEMKEFVEAPPAPPEIQALLAKAPPQQYDRLNFLRTAYYQKLVAAGGGNPIPVPPGRVVEILQGQDATPFEITAGEVLLARWAGSPARMGYGYFGGTATKNAGEVSVRPRNGATWLEVYFEGYGWVPITGTPPRARSSLSDAQKNKNNRVLATDDLALFLYVPVRLTTIQYAFVLVRHYATRILPFVLLGALLLVFYPAILKAMRRARRRKWARGRGPLAHIIVAYAEFRDLGTDLNIGLVSQTPLEFVREVEDDAEHRELAWLVTRAVWGDLSRNLEDDDARVAHDMAISVSRRLRRKQTLVSRMTAAAARSSLRTPWESDIPNMWLQWSPRAALGRRLRQVTSPVRGAFGWLRRTLVIRRPRPAGAS